MCRVYVDQCHRIPGLYLYNYQKKGIPMEILARQPDNVPEDYPYSDHENLTPENGTVMKLWRPSYRIYIFIVFICSRIAQINWLFGCEVSILEMQAFCMCKKTESQFLYSKEFIWLSDVWHFENKWQFFTRVTYTAFFNDDSFPDWPEFSTPVACKFSTLLGWTWDSDLVTGRKGRIQGFTSFVRNNDSSQAETETRMNGLDEQIRRASDINYKHHKSLIAAAIPYIFPQNSEPHWAMIRILVRVKCDCAQINIHLPIPHLDCNPRKSFTNINFYQIYCITSDFFGMHNSQKLYQTHFRPTFRNCNNETFIF